MPAGGRARGARGARGGGAGGAGAGGAAGGQVVGRPATAAEAEELSRLLENAGTSLDIPEYPLGALAAAQARLGDPAGKPGGVGGGVGRGGAAGARPAPRPAASPPPAPAKERPRQYKPGGPCDHCGATESPQWRRGPEEKPQLCNACGTRYRRGGLLQNGRGPGAKVQGRSVTVAA